MNSVMFPVAPSLILAHKVIVAAVLVPVSRPMVLEYFPVKNANCITLHDRILTSELAQELVIIKIPTQVAHEQSCSAEHDFFCTLSLLTLDRWHGLY